LGEIHKTGCDVSCIAKKCLFVIESPGFTGTTWLAQTLNLADFIYVNHGIDIKTKQRIDEDRGSKVDNDQHREDRSFYLNLIRSDANRYVEHLVNASQHHGEVAYIGTTQGLKVALAVKLDYEFKYGHIFRHPVNHINSWMSISGKNIEEQQIYGGIFLGKQNGAKYIHARAPAFAEKIEADLKKNLCDVDDEALIIMYYLFLLVPSWAMIPEKNEIFPVQYRTLFIKWVNMIK